MKEKQKLFIASFVMLFIVTGIITASIVSGELIIIWVGCSAGIGMLIPITNMFISLEV